jgi:hypothetical protein
MEKTGCWDRPLRTHLRQRADSSGGAGGKLGGGVVAGLHLPQGDRSLTARLRENPTPLVQDWVRTERQNQRARNLSQELEPWFSKYGILIIN